MIYYSHNKDRAIDRTPDLDIYSDTGSRKGQEKIMEKKLYRSKTDRKVAGVCGGIAEYFDIDPTVVRILWIIMSWVAGSGIIAYILACIFMPEE